MVNTWKYCGIFWSKNMSEGIKAIVYVEEYPEYIRKHLTSFSFAKTNTCAKSKKYSHTHVNTHNRETGKEKKERECCHSLLSLLCTELSQSGNYIFSISSPTILFTHYFLATSSFPFLSHIRYTRSNTLTTCDIPPQDPYTVSSFSAQEICVGSRHIRSNISKHTHMKWNL